MYLLARSQRNSIKLLTFVIITIVHLLCNLTAAHIHKHRSRSRSRPPTHSAQPLVADHPTAGANSGSSSAQVGPECDFLAYKQSGCEDDHGSQCNTSTGKCECKATHPIRLLDFCLPVSRLNGPCYTSGQCANVLNASCYIFGKEYDLETASGGHNLGRQVKNWPLGVCKCRLGFAFNESAGICEKRLVGSWCSNDKHCLLRSLNSICDKKRGECECSWGTAYEPHLDACGPIAVKPPTAKVNPNASGASASAKPGEASVTVSPSSVVNSHKSLYLARCESDSECEGPSVTSNLPTTSRLYQKPITNSTAKKIESATVAGPVLSGKGSKVIKSTKNYRLQCVRGRCICGASLVWEGGACREDWNIESDEIVGTNKTHHGRNRGDDLHEDEFYDESSISWQTVACMAILCSFFAGITFRACYYRKSEEDELAEDLRTAEALYAHKNAMGPQHPFNALTAAFLSKPPTIAPGAGGCAGGHKPPYGYHGPSSCYHHEPFGYNYGRCGPPGSNPSGSGMPPPLNEQDEDEYLRQEAAEKEANERSSNSKDSANPSPQPSGSDVKDKERTGSDCGSTHGEDVACSSTQLNQCGSNGCCGCECMLVVNHGAAGPILGDCCVGPMASTLPTGTCSALPNPLTREQELAQELAELEAEERKKAFEASNDEEDGETPTDEQDDDENAAILRSKTTDSCGTSNAGATLSSVVGVSTSGAGSIGRSICSTAAGLVMSQLNSNNNRTERKSTRRTSSCSSSSASLLNWSGSSTSESPNGTGTGLDATSGQAANGETVNLLVFSDPQSNAPA